ncbi:MAG: hypothetical protein FWC03_11740 [Treponema sp.]|nr:hypothetical protein [Treponema sp.]MCL2245116.1 hypothetical protein [Treponema sp.]
MASASNMQKLFAGDGKVHSRNSDSIVTVNWNPSNYKKIIKVLDGMIDKTTVRKIIDRSAKRAADAGVTATKREIAADTTLKPAQIAKSAKRYVHGSSLSAAIGLIISDTARPLSDFEFTPKKPTPKTTPIIEIYKGKKAKLSKGAFVQKMPTGHIGIYERDGENALPISQLPGPSVTGLFKANERANTLVQDVIWDTLEKRIEHELDLILSGK